jgi:hypothetical protein
MNQILGLGNLGGAENRCMLTGDYLKACGGNYNPHSAPKKWQGEELWGKLGGWRAMRHAGSIIWGS